MAKLVTRERIVEERLPHVAEAICGGRLGQLIIANGTQEPYYSANDSKRIEKAVARLKGAARENLGFAVQGLTVSCAVQKSANEKASEHAIAIQRARLQRRVGAATASHLVRTAIERKAVPFDEVELRDPPADMRVDDLIILGLASHGLRTKAITKIVGKDANSALGEVREAALGEYSTREAGFARTPRTIYTAFTEGWFQPEAGGVLRPDAVQLGMQQVFDPTTTFTSISLEA